MSEQDDLAQALAPYQLILMDLDNTLYDQRDYDRGAFAEIAMALIAHGTEQERAALVERMLTLKEDKGAIYQRLFNDVEDWFERPAIDWRQMVSLYHAHPGTDVQPARSRRALVAELVASGKRVFVVTNGRRQTQMKKIKRLDLELLLAGIYVGDPADPACPTKPDPTAYHTLVGDAAGLAVVMVGDSDTVDGGFAERAGIAFIKTLYRSDR